MLYTSQVHFYFWYVIAQLMKENIWLGTILSGVISLGRYRIILKIMESVFLTSTYVKKHVLEAVI